MYVDCVDRGWRFCRSGSGIPGSKFCRPDSGIPALKVPMDAKEPENTVKTSSKILQQNHQPLILFVILLVLVTSRPLPLAALFRT